MQKAHRVAWSLHNNRQIPDKLQVLHKCDVRNCVNPEHLFIGTNSDNMVDMVQKGRGNYKHVGSLNPNSKLTEKDIVDIRLSSVSIASLARQYTVSWSTIFDIKTRRTWTHI